MSRISTHSLFGGLSHRVRQTWLAVTKRTASVAPADLFPNAAVNQLFVDLPAHDQRHLLAVHRQALAQGLEPETCQAALLHDIGKASLTGNQVTTIERILNVLPVGLHPERTEHVSGINLARHHAAIGADRLRALGVGDRVCWLVEHHDDIDADDEQLRQLQAIDNATP